jgi:hypothetical protein
MAVSRARPPPVPRCCGWLRRNQRAPDQRLFRAGPPVAAALKAAVRRSVDVTLILPSQTDSWLVFHAGSGYYDQSLRAGAKIYERVLYDESRPSRDIATENFRPTRAAGN